MNKKISSLLIILVALAMIASPLMATVQANKPVVTEEDGYTQYVGTLGGANYVIRIPDEWNGMLVVGCHMYMGGFWHPDAQFQMDNAEDTAGIGLPFSLIGQGFAYAASSYGEGGLATKIGMIRTHQLTEYTINNYGVTGKVFLIGISMGGGIVLQLGEKYPQLYDGVLDIVGAKNWTDIYVITVATINSPMFPSLPPETQAFLLQAEADMEAACGGTTDDKPKAYERLSPVCYPDITIPIISVHGAQDPLIPLSHMYSYGIAVDNAGRSEYYREYTVDPGGHADPPVIDEALIRFEELVDYPTGW